MIVRTLTETESGSFDLILELEINGAATVIPRIEESVLVVVTGFRPDRDFGENQPVSCKRLRHVTADE